MVSINLTWIVTLVLLVALGLTACQPIQPAPPAASAPATKPAVKVLAHGAPIIGGANGLYFDQHNRLHIASVGGRAITIMDRETGAILERLGPEQGVESPDDLLVAPDGSIYWTAILTGEVGRLTPDGTKTGQMVKPGVNPITFSKDGRLFVALDFLGDALYELDPELVKPPRLIAENLGWLNAFAFGPDGYLYGPIIQKGQVARVDVDTGEVTPVAEGFVFPVAVKFDAQGRLYLLESGKDQVWRIDLTTGAKEQVATVGPGLDNLAFDGEGRLFVSSSDDGFIVEILPDGATRTVSPGGIISGQGIAVMADAQGNETVFVADVYSLRQFDGQTGAAQRADRSMFLVSDLKSPQTVAADGQQLLLSSWLGGAVQVWDPQAHKSVASYTDFAVPLNAIRFQGDLIVAELGTNSVMRAKGADPAERVPLAANLGVPIGLAADDENLWVSDWATGMVLQLMANGAGLAEPKPVASGLVAPEGLALAHDGALLVVESGAGRLSRIDLTTGKVTTVAEGLDLGAAGPPNMPPTWGFNGVAVGPAGTIYVTGDKAGVVYRIVDSR